VVAHGLPPGGFGDGAWCCSDETRAQVPPSVVVICAGERWQGVTIAADGNFVPPERTATATRTSHEDWQRKGATLSDKTARQEFGLTQDEIAGAIRAGRLQYRLSSAHGNPWLRLLRREVEDLAKAGYGDRHIKERQATAELARVNRELKRLRVQLAALEERRSELISVLAG
jgi:hypothetical protein